MKYYFPFSDCKNNILYYYTFGNSIVKEKSFIDRFTSESNWTACQMDELRQTRVARLRRMRPTKTLAPFASQVARAAGAILSGFLGQWTSGE